MSIFLVIYQLFETGEKNKYSSHSI